MAGGQSEKLEAEKEKLKIPIRAVEGLDQETEETWKLGNLEM